MKHFRTIVLLSAVAIAAAACTEAQKDDAFAIGCSAVSTADVGFQLFASSGKVSQSIINAEALAVKGAQAVCDGDRPTDVRSALAAVNKALKAIADATAQARTQVMKS